MRGILRGRPYTEAVPYVLRTWSLPAELEEVVSADLWEAGCLGCQVVDGGEGPLLTGGPLDEHAGRAAGGRVVLAAVFPEGSADDPDPLTTWGGRGVEPISVAELKQEDWLAAWREGTRPFDLGRGFRVDPREPEVAVAEAEREAGRTGHVDDRLLLSLPARQAFGVGSHESTRLAVALMEDVAFPGLEVLDVGTGTGILAMVALHLGARSAVAFDLDPAAAFAARDNAHRNVFDLLVYAGEAAALSEGARFDWALVNVIPELILPTLPEIAARVDGLVLSGILVERGAEVLEVLRPLGFEQRARLEDGEWVAFRVERKVARVAPEKLAGEAVAVGWAAENPPETPQPPPPPEPPPVASTDGPPEPPPKLSPRSSPAPARAPR